MYCKIAYIAYVVPLAVHYWALENIFDILKIHSSELIIFCFFNFFTKKKNWQRQQKINHTINTAFYDR